MVRQTAGQFAESCDPRRSLIVCWMMPRLRALAIALLLLPVTRVAAQSAPQTAMTSGRFIARHDIVVQRDTVWFTTRESDHNGAMPCGVGFVRSTGSWIARDDCPPDSASTDSAVRDSVRGTGDTAFVARLTRGFSLVQLRDSVRSESSHFPQTIHGVRHDASGRVTAVVVPDTRKNRFRMLATVEDSNTVLYENFSVGIESWITSGGSAWFGLFAGRPRVGEVAEYRQLDVPEWMGGVVHVELLSGRVTPLLHPALRSHFVSSLAVAGGDLWIGTDHYDVERSEPTVGLLRFRSADSSWTRFGSDWTPLPGSEIQRLLSIRDSLFIATDSGFAVLDTRNMQWSARYLAMDLAGDRRVIALHPSRLPVDSVLLAAVRLADHLGEPELSRFVSTARRADAAALGAFLQADQQPASFDYRHEYPPIGGNLDEAVRALSDSQFVPFLRRAFDRGRPSDARLLASNALTSIHSPVARRVADDILARGDVTSGVQIAATRAQSGDAGAVAWLRARLADPAVRRDTVVRGDREYALFTALDTVVSSLRAARDSASVPRMLDLLGSHASYQVLKTAFDIGTNAHLLTLASRIRRYPGLWDDYLHDLQWVRLDDVSNAPDGPPGERAAELPGVRASAWWISREILVRTDSALLRLGVDRNDVHQLRGYALETARWWGNASAVPVLIALFGREELNANTISLALVTLTANSAAPKLPEPSATAEQLSAARRYWTGWWSANARRFRPPDHESRTRAAQRWIGGR
jgi:hypothetical protein